MYKQAPKSPAMKALVGDQKNLPAGLKAQIEASPAKQTAKPKSKFDGYESIGESDTEKGAHLIRGKSVKSNTAATDHRMSKTAEGKYKVYKSVSPAKQTRSINLKRIESARAARAAKAKPIAKVVAPSKPVKRATKTYEPAKRATKTLVKTRIKETMVPGLKVKPIKKISVTKTVKRR